MWVLGLPLAAALVRGAIQPAIKTGSPCGPNPSRRRRSATPLSTVVIFSLVGRRALREGPAIRSGVLWFLGVGFANGGATFLLYAALGLGSITVVAPLVALFPLIGVGLSFVFLRGEQLHAVGLLGVLVTRCGRNSVADGWNLSGDEKAAEWAHEFHR